MEATLSLSTSISSLFNFILIDKIASFASMVQPFRLMNFNSRDQLPVLEDIVQPGYFPLPKEIGSTRMQRFEQYVELSKDTLNLVRVSIAQQNLYRGDMLIPFLALFALSYDLEHHMKKHEDKAALRWLEAAKRLLAENRILRNNALFYKLEKLLFVSPDAPQSFDEFLERHPLLEGEDEEAYFERVGPILNGYLFEGYHRMINAMETMLPFLNDHLKSVFSEYLELFKERLIRGDARAGFSFGKNLRELYKKHITIDIYEGRGSDLVNEAFWKKRWADPKEFMSLVMHFLDLDFVNLASEIFTIDQASKSNPSYDKLDNRLGSNLSLGLRGNLKTKIKDQARVFYDFPSLAALASQRFLSSYPLERLQSSAKTIEESFLDDYLNLVHFQENDGKKLLRALWLQPE